LHKLAEAGFPAIVRLVENGYLHFVVVKAWTSSAC
jgi:predicted double-glycine peptidase